MANVTNRNVHLYINTDKAQAKVDKLKKETESLQKAIDKGRKAGKDMTEQIEKLGKKKKQLSDLENVISGKMAPSIKMMSSYVRQLRNELSNMSKDDPEFKKKLKEFQDASKQLNSAKKNINKVNDSMRGFWGKLKDGLGIGTGIEVVRRVSGYVTAAIQNGMKWAAELEGVEAAYRKLNNPALLDDLRKATRGTLSDLELMKRAVQANNYKIPLEKLAMLFDFARRRAKDTGESVDYLVNSIVLGISRKSIPIMDNLGISSVELQKEFAKTGDFAQGAFNIIQREAKKSGKDIDSLSEKQARLNATIQNNVTKLGAYMNIAKGALSAIISDGMDGWGNKNFKEFVKNVKEAGRLNETQKAINQSTQYYYVSSFRSFTEDLASADMEGRKVIEEKAKELRERLLTDAKKQYGEDTEAFKLAQKGIRSAYKQTITYMEDNPLSFENIRNDQMSMYTKADLEDLKSQGQMALGNMRADDKDVTATLNKIKEIDKLLAKFDNNKISSADSKNTRKAENIEQLIAEYQAVQAEVEAMATRETDKLDEQQQKQLAAVLKKYEKLEARARKHGVILEGLTETQQEELRKLQERFFNERSEAEYQESKQQLDKYFALQRQETNRMYADKEMTRQQHAERMKELEREEVAARLRVATDYKETAASAEKDAQDARTEEVKQGVDDRIAEEDKSKRNIIAGLELNILTARKGSKAELEARKELIRKRFEMETEGMDKQSKEYLLRQEQMQMELAQLEKEYITDKIQSHLDAARQLIDIWSNFMRLQQQAAEAEFRREAARIDKQKKHYDELLESKRVSKEIYDKKTAELDQERETKEQELKKKAFEQEKKMSLIQVQMSAAQAIMSIWSKYSALPWLAAILTAGVGAVTIAQTNAIQRQSYPEYATGKMPGRGTGGVPEGARHAVGGIKLVDSQTGNIVGEMEGDEPILSTATYRNNKKIVDALLYTSMHRGGSKIPDGLMSIPTPINMPAATSAIQTRPVYAQGRTPTAGTATSDNSDLVYIDASVVQRLTDVLEMMEQNGLQAHVYKDEIDRHNKTLLSIKKRSKMHHQ